MMNTDRSGRLAHLLIHLIGHTTCTGYVIALTDSHTLSITCLVCGATSFNPTDVAEKYCGACHAFHEYAVPGSPGDDGTVDPPRPVTLLRLRHRQLGGHVHCRLFSAHGAKHGDLVFDEREWPAVRAALAQVMDVAPDE